MARVPDLEKHPDITEKVCAHIRNGNTIKDSCAAVGVGESTYHQWVAHAEKGHVNPCYAAFAEQTTRALAEAKAALVKNISDAGAKDWKASAHILACRDPENYAVRRKFEHSGNQGGPIEVRTYDAINLPATSSEDESGED